MKKSIHRAALAAIVLPSPKTASLRASGAFSAAGVEVNTEKSAILNAAVITIGPAEGHGFSIDAKTLEQVASLINASPGGVPVRFRHPSQTDAGGVSPETLGTDVGYLRNARVEGNSVRGDVYLADYAEVLPGLGNAKEYLLRKAKSDPAGFGLSAVIGFELEPQKDGGGNVTGLMARVGAVEAVDFVSRPAANPNGLLSSQQPPTKPIQPNVPRAAGKKTGVLSMNPNIKQCLTEGYNLPADATDEQAQTMYDSLSASDKAAVDAKCTQMAAKPPTNPLTPLAAKPPQSPAPEVGEQVLAMAGRRVAQLQQLGNTLNVDADVVKLAIAEGDDVPAAQTRYLKHLQEKCRPIEGLNHSASISVGQNKNLESLRVAIPQAMLSKIGRDRLYAMNSDGRVIKDADGCPLVEKPHERVAEIASLRIRDIFREYLAALGVNPREISRVSDDRLAKAFSHKGMQQVFPRVAMLAQGLDDFDSILANVQNKGIRMAYVEMSSTWQMWCGRRTVSDFKNISDVQISDVPDLTVKDPNGRYRRVQVSDSKETWALVEYGHIVAFTRRALLNDDINAYSQIPNKEASAARRLEETLAYQVLTNNATMFDTNALFSSNHSNYDTATANVGAPNVTTLGLARKALRLQTAPKGAILNLIPKFLIVPAALENVAEQYTSANYVAAVQTSINPFASSGRTPLVPIVQPRLDANSATKWYAAADPNQIDTVKLAFLESEQEPMLEQNTDFNSDDVEYKVRHACAATALDHRGLYANAGA